MWDTKATQNPRFHTRAHNSHQSVCSFFALYLPHTNYLHMNRTTYIRGSISSIGLAAVIVLIVVAGGGGYYLIKKNEEQKDLGSANSGILKDIEEFGKGKHPGKNAPTEWSASACDYLTLAEAQKILGKDAVEKPEDITANSCDYTIPNTNEVLAYDIAFRDYPLEWADELMKRGLDAGTHTQIFGTTDRAWYIGVDITNEIVLAFVHKNVLAHIWYKGKNKPSIVIEQIKPLLRTIGERYPDVK